MSIPEHLSDEQILDQISGGNDLDAMAHIAACARCRQEYEEYLATVELFRECLRTHEDLADEIRKEFRQLMTQRVFAPPKK